MPSTLGRFRDLPLFWSDGVSEDQCQDVNRLFIFTVVYKIVSEVKVISRGLFDLRTYRDSGPGQNRLGTTELSD
ncbi:hypothetical protein M8J77_021849 [Diaphorina citri]|nr:hypothetical protein M8J77_021849 [Diaphorina citri]